MFKSRIRNSMRLVVICLVMSAAMLSPGQDQIPVFAVTPEDSTIKFNVKASVALVGTFEKWDSTLTFTSTDVSTGVMDLKIQADTVHTGSGMKDGKLKSKDFFDVKESPLITFHSTKVVQTGPDTVEFDGDFAIRGVTKPEKLTFTITG